MEKASREMTVIEEIKNLHLEKSIEERIINKVEHMQKAFDNEVTAWQKLTDEQYETIKAYRIAIKDLIVSGVAR